jgi:biofilm protein TabA
MVIDNLKNCEMYYSLNKNFEKSFAFIKEYLKAPKENGTYEIDGQSVYALVMDVQLKDMGRMETHKKYIDIQYIVKGSEIVRLINKQYLEVEEDCTPKRDVIFYKPNKGSSEVKFFENNFMIFFPEDGHEPGILLEESTNTKKIVVKVGI